MPGFEAVFGKLGREYRDETQHRIRVFREAIAGKPVQFRSPELLSSDPPEFFVRPRAPELGDRLWYGAGSVPSAQTTAKIGLDLLQSTLNINPTADTFEKTQRNNIEAYLEAWELPRRPRVRQPAVHARGQPATARALRRVRRHPPGRGPGRPSPRGAQDPGTFQRALRNEDQLRNVQLCPIYHGDPDYVLERARADDGVQLADELMIWLPPNFTLAENKELLDNIVEFIAPELGWQPAEAAASAA